MSYSFKDDPDLFSRQQVQQFTGVPDDVLQFWLKQGLLRPVEASSRKHRRFMPEQLQLAVILNELRSLGANVGVLRKFSDMFHGGRELLRLAASRAMEKPDGQNGLDLRAIVALASSFVSNDRGLKVNGRLPPKMSRAQIIESHREFWGELCSESLIIEIAGELSDYEISALSVWADIQDIDQGADNCAWLFWIEPSGEPRLASGVVNEFALRGHRHPRSAFYIGISECLGEITTKLKNHDAANRRAEAADRPPVHGSST